MTDIDAIRQIIAQYCHFIDDGYEKGLKEIFAEDLLVELGPQRFEGRDEALKFFGAAANLGKHVTVNTQIGVDATTATGVSDFLFLDKENKPSTVGRYEDRFRKEGDAWKFTQRRILFAGS